MNILEKFIRSKSKTNYKFAQIVGKSSQTIHTQIVIDREVDQKNSIIHLIEYMQFFKVNEFQGFYNGNNLKIIIY